MAARGIVILAVLCAIVTFLRYVPIGGDPLDGSMASLNAAYTARYIQCWDNAGFAALRGAPHLYVSPTDPLERDPYLHHPPLYPWLVYLTVKVAGFSEWGFRALPILFASLAGGILVWLVGRGGGTWSAAAAGLLYAASPMSLFFGWMPNPESAALFAILLTIAAHEALRAAPRGRYAIVITIFFAGTWLDWQAAFAAPALWLREAGEPAPARRLARSFILLPAGIVSFCCVLAVYATWMGGVEPALHLVTSTASATASGAEKEIGARWLRNQIQFWRELYSWPVLAACAAAIPAICYKAFRRRDALARTAAALAVPGALNILLFRKHAFDHYFWWYYAVPFAAAAPAWLAARIASARPPICKILAAALILLCAGWSLAQVRERYHYWKNPMSPIVAADWNRIAPRGTGLLLPFEIGQESFYVQSWIFNPARDGEHLKRIAAQFREGKVGVPRIVCVVPESICGVLSFTSLVELLPQLGPVKSYDAMEFAALAPALSGQLCSPRVHILTLE